MMTMGLGARRPAERWPRWGAVIHGSVVTALIAGLAALWATLALTAALLAAPLDTMQVFERKGAWGAVDALGQGTAVLVDWVMPMFAGER